MSEVIMDFPEAWKFCADTKLEDHHEQCSYRTEDRGVLCDCDILNHEYARRKAKREKGGVDDSIRENYRKTRPSQED